eukprot:GHVN01035474.1.p1 GENE.GHVN01035474.1~~GHVN01035474.1.p1  ORF type:complete len:2273 (+),score=222.55 GHVN01035474.1:395-6820(+)
MQRPGPSPGEESVTEPPSNVAATVPDAAAGTTSDTVTGVRASFLIDIVVGMIVRGRGVGDHPIMININHNNTTPGGGGGNDQNRVLFVPIAAPEAPRPSPGGPSSDRNCLLISSFGGLEAIERLFINSVEENHLTFDILTLLHEIFFDAPQLAVEAMGNNPQVIRRLFAVIANHQFNSSRNSYLPSPPTSSQLAQGVLEDLIGVREAMVDLSGIPDFDRMVSYMSASRLSSFCRLLILLLYEAEDKTAAKLFANTAQLFRVGGGYEYPSTLSGVEFLWAECEPTQQLICNTDSIEIDASILSMSSKASSTHKYVAAVTPTTQERITIQHNSDMIDSEEQRRQREPASSERRKSERKRPFNRGVLNSSQDLPDMALSSSDDSFTYSNASGRCSTSSGSPGSTPSSSSCGSDTSSECSEVSFDSLMSSEDGFRPKPRSPRQSVSNYAPKLLGCTCHSNPWRGGLQQGLLHLSSCQCCILTNNRRVMRSSRLLRRLMLLLRMQSLPLDPALELSALPCCHLSSAKYVPDPDPRMFHFLSELLRSLESPPGGVPAPTAVRSERRTSVDATVGGTNLTASSASDGSGLDRPRALSWMGSDPEGWPTPSLDGVTRNSFASVQSANSQDQIGQPFTTPMAYDSRSRQTLLSTWPPVAEPWPVNEEDEDGESLGQSRSLSLASEAGGLVTSEGHQTEDNESAGSSSLGRSEIYRGLMARVESLNRLNQTESASLPPTTYDSAVGTISAPPSESQRSIPSSDEGSASSSQPVLVSFLQTLRSLETTLRNLTQDIMSVVEQHPAPDQVDDVDPDEGLVNVENDSNWASPLDEQQIEMRQAKKGARDNFRYILKLYESVCEEQGRRLKRLTEEDNRIQKRHIDVESAGGLPRVGPYFANCITAKGLGENYRTRKEMWGRALDARSRSTGMNPQYATQLSSQDKGEHMRRITKPRETQGSGIVQWLSDSVKEWLSNSISSDDGDEGSGLLAMEPLPALAEDVWLWAARTKLPLDPTMSNLSDDADSCMSLGSPHSPPRLSLSESPSSGLGQVPLGEPPPHLASGLMEAGTFGEAHRQIAPLESSSRQQRAQEDMSANGHTPFVGGLSLAIDQSRVSTVPPINPSEIEIQYASTVKELTQEKVLLLAVLCALFRWRPQETIEMCREMGVIETLSRMFDGLLWLTTGEVPPSNPVADSSQRDALTASSTCENSCRSLTLEYLRLIFYTCNYTTPANDKAVTRTSQDVRLAMLDPNELALFRKTGRARNVLVEPPLVTKHVVTINAVHSDPESKDSPNKRSDSSASVNGDSTESESESRDSPSPMDRNDETTASRGGSAVSWPPQKREAYRYTFRNDAGLFSKILTVYADDPCSSPYKYWLACCIEVWLRRADPLLGLFAYECGLLDILLRDIASDTSGNLYVLQVSCDLLSELINFNPYIYAKLDDRFRKDPGLFRRFSNVLLSNLHDSNVLIRSLTMTAEFTIQAAESQLLVSQLYCKEAACSIWSSNRVNEFSETEESPSAHESTYWSLFSQTFAGRSSVKEEDVNMLCTRSESDDSNLLETVNWRHLHPRSELPFPDAPPTAPPRIRTNRKRRALKRHPYVDLLKPRKVAPFSPTSRKDPVSESTRRSSDGRPDKATPSQPSNTQKRRKTVRWGQGKAHGLTLPFSRYSFGSLKAFLAMQRDEESRRQKAENMTDGEIPTRSDSTNVHDQPTMKKRGIRPLRSAEALAQKLVPRMMMYDEVVLTKYRHTPYGGVQNFVDWCQELSCTTRSPASYDTNPSPLTSFLYRNRTDIIHRLICVLPFTKISPDNVCCLNTAVLLFLFAALDGELKETMDNLDQKAEEDEKHVKDWLQYRRRVKERSRPRRLSPQLLLGENLEGSVADSSHKRSNSTAPSFDVTSDKNQVIGGGSSGIPQREAACLRPPPSPLHSSSPSFNAEYFPPPMPQPPSEEGWGSRTGSANQSPRSSFSSVAGVALCPNLFWPGTVKNRSDQNTVNECNSAERVNNGGREAKGTPPTPVLPSLPVDPAQSLTASGANEDQREIPPIKPLSHKLAIGFKHFPAERRRREGLSYAFYNLKRLLFFWYAHYRMQPSRKRWRSGKSHKKSKFCLNRGDEIALLERSCIDFRYWREVVQLICAPKDESEYSLYHYTLE